MPDHGLPKPCRPGGSTNRDSGTVTLTDGQARCLVLSGHLTEVAQGSPAPEASKPNRKGH